MGDDTTEPMSVQIVRFIIWLIGYYARRCVPCLRRRRRFCRDRQGRPIIAVGSWPVIRGEARHKRVVRNL